MIPLLTSIALANICKMLELSLAPDVDPTPYPSLLGKLQRVNITVKFL